MGATKPNGSATRYSPLVARQALRVCADPNDLPYSNAKGEGFENKLVELVARDLGARVEYTWWAQRRGFFRNTLNAGLCDVVPGAPVGVGGTLATRPYYRAGYVFVSRHGGSVHPRTLDDPVLRRARIGVQLAGGDHASTPPGYALARRHITSNVRGYSIFADYAQPNPSSGIVTAVAAGEVDVAVVWGPLAGYFAKHSAVPLDITPIPPPADRGALPFAFDVGMAVRTDDVALRDTLDQVLARHAAEVARLLDEYDVPRLTPTPAHGGRT